MQYYIDFDSTIYDTNSLVEKMLRGIAFEICRQDNGLNIEEMYLEAKKLFNSKNIYNIFKLCEFFANKYSLELDGLVSRINNILSCGDGFVYNDSVEFLKDIKARENTINMLTYSSQDGLDYQMKKILGSGLVKYFDNLIITSTPKWQLDIDYSQGIFIDDNPKDLIGLYGKNPRNLIRIKRVGNKYSDKPMPDDIRISEYTSLEEININ